jgi:hypothetical protein
MGSTLIGHNPSLECQHSATTTGASKPKQLAGIVISFYNCEYYTESNNIMMMNCVEYIEMQS